MSTKKFKRITVLLLTIALIFTSIPTNVYSTENTNVEQTNTNEDDKTPTDNGIQKTVPTTNENVSPSPSDNQINLDGQNGKDDNDDEPKDEPQNSPEIITPTILSFIVNPAEDGRGDIYENNTPYANYTLEYSEKNTIPNYLPSTVWVNTNEETSLKQINVTWTSENDPMTENLQTYVYTMHIPEEYKMNENLQMPFIEFHINESTKIIKFVDMESEEYIGDKPYFEHTMNFIEKSTIMDYLPETIDVYFEDSSSPETINVNWICSFDPMTYDAIQYIYTVDIPIEYSLDSNLQLPYLEFNVFYTINSIANYNPELPYKEINVDYNKKEDISNILPTTMEVLLDGFEETIEIPVSWTCEKDFINTTDETYKFNFNISDSYVFEENFILPYINVNINKTITGFATNDGNSIWNSSSPYVLFSIPYTQKEATYDKFPKQIYAYINDASEPTLVDVTWLSDVDMLETNDKKYVYTASITNDQYTMSDLLTRPFIEVNITQTITSFIGYDYNNGAYATYRLDVTEKENIKNLLPTNLLGYANENTSEELTIPVTWTCKNDPLTTNLTTYTYVANISNDYVLSYALQQQIPYITINIIDATQFSGKSETYNYNGTIQRYVAPQTGTYKLTVRGAQGGNGGGYGGYSTGNVTLQQGQVVYVVVGGMGSKSNTSALITQGGYNGGGNASRGAGTGGGATHIATTSGLLENLSSAKNSILIVAGGGGGNGSGGTASYGGGGGGLEGLGSYDASIFKDWGVTPAQTGGTQTSGYAFGKGQPSNTTPKDGYYAGAGGGGWYGGLQGPALLSDLRGGGGSGYVGGVSNYQTTADINSGNGKATIEYIGSISSTLTIDVGNGGTWNGQTGQITVTNPAETILNIPNPTPKTGYKFIGWEVVSGDGKIVNGNYTFTLKNTIIKAKWLAPLILSSNVTNNQLTLNFIQEDSYTKVYRVYESIDTVNWYLATSNSETAAQVKTWKYNYTGTTQVFTAPADGWYTLTVWGAQGGGANGGRGASVTGKVQLTAGQKLYVNVGSQPGGSNGGWNGGGNNGGGAVHGGGGATDISLYGTAGTSNWNTSNHLYSRLIVAGGGGGYNALGGNSGGAGGAWNGSNGGGNDFGYGGTLSGGGMTASGGLGKQNDGGFGYGGSASWCGEYLGGGGGGWYGGGSGGGWFNNGSGGGGSSYAWTGSLASYYPSSGYKPSTALYLSEVSATPNARSGNGYATITYADIVLSKNELTNVAMADKAAPNKISEAFMVDPTSNTPSITWNVPTDNGTLYYHRVKSYILGNLNTVLQTSNITSDIYTSGIYGYRYYIDGNASGTVTGAHTFVATNKVTISKPTTRQYLHIAAVDKAGNIGGTYNFEIKPITYYVQYNSNVATDTTASNSTYRDSRTFYYGTNYTFLSNPFTKNGTGYYGQTLKYNFIGWGFKNWSSFTKTNANYPYLYKTNLVIKLTGFMQSNPVYVPASVKNNSQERLYYYQNDIFNNLTNVDEEVVNLYAEWIADNQRPYGGFTLKTLVYNDDGTPNGTIKENPYDSYNVSNYNETSKQTIVYDDAYYFLNTQYRDPEGNTCSADYQYSIDNGATWYKLDINVGTKVSSYFTVSKVNTNSGNLLALKFAKDKTTLIRMRVKDEVTYPIGYKYNITNKTYETYTLQKSMWSTGYFVDTTHVDYDANGMYLGDYGTKGNQGGSWYVKTIRSYEGNKAPFADLVADDLDISSLPENYTFEDIISLMEQQNFFNFPMYDYTVSGETWGYKNGKIYILVSNDFEAKAHCTNDEELIDKFFDSNLSKFNYLKDTEVVLIKESENYQYTTFTPEDESIAFLNASYDTDSTKHSTSPTSSIDKLDSNSYYNKGSLVGNSAFSHYWIAICEKGTFENVLSIGTDENTNYNSQNTSNGTSYTKTYNGHNIQGLIYDSYEQMVKDIYARSGSVFATISDVDLSMYDVYFSVCDKSWNLVSPNKWGTVVKKTLVVEPTLTIYDVLINDTTSTKAQYDTNVSLYRNDERKAYYHIGGYSLSNGKYKNIDKNWENGFVMVGTMLTRYSNATKNHVLNDEATNFVTENGSMPTRTGYYYTLNVATHGAEKVEISLLNRENKITQVITPPTFADNNTFEQFDGTMSNMGVISYKTSRRPLDKTQFYNVTNFKYAFAEQDAYNNGYYIKIAISKVPYTTHKTLERIIYIGDATNPLFKIDNSMLNDVGVSVTN